MTESIVTAKATERPDAQVLAGPFLPLKDSSLHCLCLNICPVQTPVVLWEAHPPSSARMEGDAWGGVGLRAHEQKQVTLGQDRASSLGWRLD